MRPTTLLLLVSFAVATLFSYCRSRSSFLDAERDVEAARQVARQYGLSTGEVLALHEGVGVQMPSIPEGERVARLVTETARWSSKRLALLALSGHELLATELLARARGDVAAAEAALAQRPQQVEIVRFFSVAERFDRRFP